MPLLWTLPVEGELVQEKMEVAKFAKERLEAESYIFQFFSFQKLKDWKPVL